MMFSIARTLAICTIAAVLAVVRCAAQSAPTAQPSTAQPKSQSNQSGQSSPAGQPSQPSRQVIFSRSIDSSGQTTSKTGSGANEPAIQMAAAPLVEDADRQAIRFTDFDMDVRLHTAAQQLV